MQAPPDVQIAKCARGLIVCWNVETSCVDCNDRMFLLNIPGRLYCESVWDRWGCWNYTLAGSRAFIPCPSYIEGFDSRRKGRDLPRVVCDFRAVSFFCTCRPTCSVCVAITVRWTWERLIFKCCKNSIGLGDKYTMLLSLLSALMTSVWETCDF